MTVFTKLGVEINAPVTVAGQPRGAAMLDEMVWKTEAERIMQAFTSNGGLIYGSRATLYADLAHGPQTMAWVITDTTAAYNGIYLKSSGSGFGLWTRVADLPYSFVRLFDAGAGTANAIQLTSALPTSQSVLRTANIFEANTGNVTIAENGGTDRSLRTSSGNHIEPAGLSAGMVIAYIDDGTNFRLLSDVASASVINAAIAAKDAAETARDATIVAKEATEDARDDAIAAAAAAAAVVGFQFFATIAALRANTNAALSNVYVLEYSAAARSGTGWFVKDGSDTTSSDNGGTIIVDAGGRRWKITNAPIVTARMFGASPGSANARVEVQRAIDSCSVLGIKCLWFDEMYTIGGAKHANTYSIIDWKQVSLLGIGNGGLKLADNTNVMAAQFTATVSGTTMTVSAVASGLLAGSQFLTGLGLPVAVQIVTQLSGTAQGVGTYQLTAAATIAAPITVRSVARFVEMLGNYDMTTGLKDVTCGIEFDYNGANNCGGGTLFSFNSIVTVNKPVNVTFDGAKFRNNCGSNDLVLGQVTSLTTAQNVVISGCLFENEGDRVNAASGDFSSIFCCSVGLRIENNTFRDGPTTNGCPMEVYGHNVLMIGNTIQGYYNTGNIVAQDGLTISNVVYAGNIVKDCSVGLTLWAMTATSKIHGCNIVGNNFEFLVTSPGGPYFLNATDQVDDAADLRDIVIEGNSARNMDLTDTTRDATGIKLKSLNSARVRNNTLYGFAGRGVHITKAHVNATIDVSGNDIINCGFGAVGGSAQRVGLQFDASVEGPAANLIVSGNKVNPLAGYTMTAGIVGAMTAASGFVGDNAITGCTTEIDWSGANAAKLDRQERIGAITFVGGFANTGGAYSTTTVKRLRDGTVLLEGIITAGTISGATLFTTLPVGFRPSGTAVRTGWNLDAVVPCQIRILSDGRVYISSGAVTGNIFDLGGIKFTAAG